jgi:hypothetical protein
MLLGWMNFWGWQTITNSLSKGLVELPNQTLYSIDQSWWKVHLLGMQKKQYLQKLKVKFNFAPILR